MTVSSAAARLGIITNMKVDVGMALLPYYADVKGAPQNSIIGGASLWVLRGQKPEDYKGVAQFFAHLSQPEVQAWWHQQTGYLPITTAAYELTRKQGFYDKNPGTDVAVRGDQSQSADRELEGFAPRQLRADPGHRRGRGGERSARQEDAATGP